MNSQFKLNLIKHLSNKKANKGFTLIELLVVVIIIGVLAAIALPNLLGQVGKARESEAKSIIGALNRSQQAYYTEHSEFAPEGETADDLEVPTGNEKFYDAVKVWAGGVQSAYNDGSVDGKNNQDDGTRDYVGASQYDIDSRTFSAVVCRVDKDKTAPDSAANAGTYVTADADGKVDAGDPVTCEGDSKVIR
jgi:type IV pilus assembly protein PilA